MNQLIDAVFNLVKDLNEKKVSALAKKIRSLSYDDTLPLIGYFNNDAINRYLTSVLDQWKETKCSSDELAGLLIGISQGCIRERQSEKVQLVWTGPDIKQLPVRRSEQILLELIDKAKTSLYLVSFVLVNIPGIEEALRQALLRDVDVRMLLESEDKDGTEEFSKKFSRLQEDIPGITLYVWPREKRDYVDGGFASVHAKCAVADRQNAFITSANLTSAALDKNIEMGVSIEGGDIPAAIYEQFVGMIRTNEIVPYQSLDKKSFSPVSNSIHIEKLNGTLKPGYEFILHFNNEILGVEEKRRFKALEKNSDKPKKNSVVLIRHSNAWVVGKYAWQRQQGIDDQDEFFQVSVRGFSPKISFEIKPCDWDDFCPDAIEIIA